MDSEKNTFTGTSVCVRPTNAGGTEKFLESGKRYIASVPEEEEEEEDTQLGLLLEDAEILPTDSDELPIEFTKDKVINKDMLDWPHESIERCSTPIPIEQDAWLEVLPKDVPDVSMDVVPPDEDGEPSSRSPPNLGTTHKESVQRNATGPKVPGLPGMVLAVLNNYYEVGPRACRKPEWDAFYNHFRTNDSQFVPRTRNPHEDFIDFVGSGSVDPEPEDHFGYRVLNDSLWLTEPITVESKDPYIEHETEQSSLENSKRTEERLVAESERIERGKNATSPKLEKETGSLRTTRKRISFLDDVAKLSLTENPRCNGVDTPEEGNTVLANPSTDCLDLEPKVLDKELSGTRKNSAQLEYPTEFDHSAMEVLPKQESDEWDEELDYD